jgi:SAM-dependent methyltransferase
MNDMRTCPICGQQPRPVEPLISPFSAERFELGVCDRCELSLVLNPRTDFDELYGPDYYAGKGADPLIDYAADEARGSLREIEWSGLLDTVSAIAAHKSPPTAPLRLLDWGAGLGGLVRMARERGMVADGLDAGYAAKVLEEKGFSAPPAADASSQYDVITAIEVVEHLLDPIAELRAMAAFLKPGGFLFITTGNVAKARGPLNKWYYAQVPDVHVTFWSPNAWSKALQVAGFEPSPLPFARVDPRVVQYKVIKALPKYRGPLKASMPVWRPLSRVVDSRYGVSEFPVGWKAKES